MTTKKAAENKAAEVDSLQEEAAQVETVSFDVKLKNGREVRLEVIKNQEDWPLEAGIRAQRSEQMAFVDLVLTPKSRYVLHQMGPKMGDFYAIVKAMGEVVGPVGSAGDSESED